MLDEAKIVERGRSWSILEEASFAGFCATLLLISPPESSLHISKYRGRFIG